MFLYIMSSTYRFIDHTVVQRRSRVPLGARGTPAAGEYASEVSATQSLSFTQVFKLGSLTDLRAKRRLIALRSGDTKGHGAKQYILSRLSPLVLLFVLWFGSQYFLPTALEAHLFCFFVARELNRRRKKPLSQA
ncbi:hypothetical protein MN608_04102 [Microdochium nivale]|nr:hypothetical protein MN608_04102 [Microdochium nivale]